MSHSINDQYYEDMREEFEELEGEIYSDETGMQALARERASHSLFGMSRRQVASLLNGASEKGQKMMNKTALRLNFGKNLERYFDPDSTQYE